MIKVAKRQVPIKTIDSMQKRALKTWTDSIVSIHAAGNTIPATSASQTNKTYQSNSNIKPKE